MEGTKGDLAPGCDLGCSCLSFHPSMCSLLPAAWTLTCDLQQKPLRDTTTDTMDSEASMASPGSQVPLLWLVSVEVALQPEFASRGVRDGEEPQDGASGVS
jgi:hypothetical protein